MLIPPTLATPELAESREVVFGRLGPLLLLLPVTSDTPESSNTASSLFSREGGWSVTGLCTREREKPLQYTINVSTYCYSRQSVLTEVTASMIVTSSSQYRNLSTASSTLVNKFCTGEQMNTLKRDQYMILSPD